MAMPQEKVKDLVNKYTCFFKPPNKPPGTSQNVSLGIVEENHCEQKQATNFGIIYRKGGCH